MHRTETDGQLVAAVLAGDRRSFAVLVERHVGQATALIGRLLTSPVEVEDIVQEAVLQSYLGLRELRDPERFGAWFLAIATNLAKMRLRQTRGRLVPLHDVDARLASDDGFEARERLRTIHEALADLSPAEREAVVLHYLAGLTTPEIALRGGERVGTVRVRLHRARGRLQGLLAPLTPTTEAPTRRLRPSGTRALPALRLQRPVDRLGSSRAATRKERQMIEVEVQDVVVRVARNGDGQEPSLAMPNRIVLLAEKEGQRLLPIWIGPPEGDALGLHLAGVSTPRPMTVDLMVRLLEVMGGRVERVVVSSLREDTFYAAVHIADGARHELDARPSDGINLAQRVGAPIFVDEEVLEAAGFPAADEAALEIEYAERCAKHGQEPPAGEWRSLTPDLMTSWLPPLER